MVNNYINLVVLGNFNPSILTHDFLVKECGIVLGDKPIKENPPMPVVASLEYEKISFFADLGRLQITEKNCKEPKQSKLPSYLDTYLKKLPHTPITKSGANFSYGLEIEDARLKKIEQALSNDRQYFRKALDTDEIQLEVVFNVSDSSESIKKWILRTISQYGESSTTMNVQRLQSLKFKIDFNYEINLEKNKEQIKKITDSYVNVYDTFLFQLKKIFGEDIS